jgi:hypothetical protein
MAESPVQFLRGTFYRWAQLFPEICPELNKAPAVLAVGDLHIASFGTWRDAFGRLTWGIDDFDEAYPLPYTNDLMRLGVSAILDASEGEIKVGLRNVAEVILDGYRSGLSEGGKPFVLEEKHKWLRKIALDCLDIPAEFWKKMDALPANRKDGPGDARKANRPPAAGTAIEIPSRSSHSGHRQSRPLPVRGCGQLVRRPDRLGSESSNTVRMCLGPAWETLAHLLSGDAGAGDPLSRSVCALMRQMAGSPAWRPIPRRSKLKDEWTTGSGQAASCHGRGDGECPSRHNPGDAANHGGPEESVRQVATGCCQRHGQDDD